jgi:tripartite-type tricarboxylate transporter receptor subunit TctC
MNHQTRIIRHLSALALLPLTGSAINAVAANPAYPTKPIRVVVGFSPGGGADIVARLVSPKLTQVTGQSVIVDNRPGAGGSIAAGVVSNSTPDGYTILAISSSYAVIPSLYPTQAFDPAKDLTGVSLLAEAPLLLVVNPSLPAKSVQELIALARSRAGQMNYASGGEATSGHLAGELFKRMAGVDVVHVPYKGAGPAMVDVIAGQIQMQFAAILTTLPHVKNNALRALAVTSLKRSTVLPQLPTVSEVVKGYNRTTWYALLAPSRTPKPIVDKLSAETAKALNSPDIRDNFAADGGEVKGGSPQQAQDYVLNEITVSRQIIDKTDMRK